MRHFLDSSASPDRWQYFANGGCAELTARNHTYCYRHHTIPFWMNEGLATFMEDTSRTNYRDVMSIECLDGKFASYYNGTREEIPFMSLQNAKYDFNVPESIIIGRARAFGSISASPMAMKQSRRLSKT